MGACGAAYLVEHDVACLRAASAATLLAPCHFPRPNRVSLWVARQLRQIDEARQVRRLTANA
ncbi:MAG TPA: hypothetical protein VGX78_21580 [Pirellulales bacterium]|nr:hypothetical protein [Pirellulales bacterium]